MLPTLFLVLQALAGASASVIHVRQNSDSVASNIPTQQTFNEPARGEGRRILGELQPTLSSVGIWLTRCAVWGRPDLALTVLGEPAAGTAVGV